MLVRLEIENFYCFRDRQIVDLRAAKNAPDLPGRFGPPFPGSSDRVPKVVAVFGANASGKSTILRAMVFLKWLVRESFQSRPSDPLPLMAFHTEESVNQPTRLAVSFGSSIVESEDPCLYRYELEVAAGKDSSKEIAREALKFYPKGKARRIFERAGNRTRGSRYLEISEPALHRLPFRSNASALSTLAQFGHPLATRIYEAMELVLTNMFHHRVEIDPSNVTSYYAGNASMLDSLNRHIQKIDIGVDRVRIEQTPDGPKPLFHHRGLDRLLTLASESHGTQSFYTMFPSISHALATGGLAIIDELDNDIHPLVLPEILRWFQDPKNNPHDAQLLMTCHNASLLEELTKEEVLFTQKNPDGACSVYGLADVTNVRRTDNLYKKYLGGAFGAIPHVG